MLYHYIRHVFHYTGFVLFIIAFLGCQSTLPKADREDLFRIRYGLMDDELDVFERDGTLFSKNTSIVMHDGLIYVSNPFLGKVIKFSGYGDILSLIYNEKLNPVMSHDEGQRRITQWDIDDMGETIVDAQGHILIDTKAKNSNDKEQPNAGRLIIEFDADNNYVRSLGSRGLGYDPLPNVAALHTNQTMDRIIIARNNPQWQVYWYDKKGQIKYETTHFDELAPDLPEYEQMIFRIQKIMPDSQKDVLYLLVQSQAEENSLDKTYTSVTAILTYDMKTGTIISHTVFKALNNKNYELIGVDAASRLYFLSSFTEVQNKKNGYVLDVINSQGEQDKQLFLVLPPQQTPLYRSLHVAPQGIVSALFFYPKDAQVMWWRVDRLFDKKEGK
jgi:hypothetical protein